MCVPSVARVDDACVDLVWRLIFGTPLCSVRSNATLPSRLFRHTSFQVCGVSSITDSTLPYRPGFNPASARPLIAVVTHRLSPQMIGLEWPRPAIGADHFTPFFSGTLHAVGAGLPSDTPAA